MQYSFLGLRHMEEQTNMIQLERERRREEEMRREEARRQQEMMLRQQQEEILRNDLRRRQEDSMMMPVSIMFIIFTLIRHVTFPPYSGIPPFRP